MQRSATLPASPRRNVLLRHHKIYREEDPDISDQENQEEPEQHHYPVQGRRYTRIRFRPTSAEQRAGELNNVSLNN